MNLKPFLFLTTIAVLLHLALAAQVGPDGLKPIDTSYVPLGSTVNIDMTARKSSFANRLYHQLDSILKKETGYGLASMDGRENDKDAVVLWLQKNITAIGNNAGRASDLERTSSKAELDCGWFCKDAAFTFTLAFATINGLDTAVKQTLTHKKLETSDHIYAYTGYPAQMLVDVSLTLTGKGKSIPFRMPAEGIVYLEDNSRVLKEARQSR